MRVRLRVIFSGRVQGVFFRAHAQKFASKYNLDGWVRNTEEGDVEALFEGEEEDISKVIEKCEHEQPYARVENIQIFKEEIGNDLKGFRIKY